jgi:hypothetical protein
MTRKTTGLIAAGSLAIGIALGGAGAIVARDYATPDMANHTQGMTSRMSMMGAGSMGDMGSMMGAGSMGDMGSMMSMMGDDSPMTPSASMGPDASMSPQDHESHHVSPSPAATR